MTTKKKSGGAKTTRSETVTVRLDPQLRYLAEIAARIQRRTLSSYVEWAIIESLKQNKIDDKNEFDDRTVSDMAANLWDVDDADRFVKLALAAPHLLNYDEQRLWKLIQEFGEIWRGKWVAVGSDGLKSRWTWTVNESSIIYQRLRNYWEELNKIANDGGGVNDLPYWAKEIERPKPPKAPDDDSDDDIPF